MIQEVVVQHQHQQQQHEDEDEEHVGGVVETIVIVGTGLMGAGIAQVAIESGVRVTMVGRTQEKCTATMGRISGAVEKTAKRRFPDEPQSREEFVKNALNRIDFKLSIFEANLAEADLVLEAVVENLKVKQKLFADLEPRVSDRCLLVTNTSSLLLEDVGAKLDRPDHFGGLHFFNPVPAMKLVEVVQGPDTSDKTNAALSKFVEQIGKTPVKCKDTPGFIVNRLLLPYLADAMRLAAGGDAEVTHIDTAMRLGTGHPMGPFELIDYIGLDTMKFILDGWHQRFPQDARFEPLPSLEKLVSAGKLGRKTGEGFYRYGGGGGAKQQQK